MNPERFCTPALRLEDGKLLTGHSHLELAFEAMEMGLERYAVVGHVDSKGIFRPIYPIDEELIPNLKNENDAIKFAENCSKSERDACERLSTGNDLLKVVVNRWDSLRRLPMVIGIKRLDSNYVYTDGAAHGTIVTRHPDITLVESASHWKQLAIAGFLHDDGMFLTREQAANVCLGLGGFPLEKRLLSGEEWVPPLKDKDDAIDFGKKMHNKGYNQVIHKIRIFSYLKKNLEYVDLLKIAKGENENKVFRR